MGAFRLSNLKLAAFVNFADVVFERVPFIHVLGRNAISMLLPALKNYLCPQPEFELYFRNSVTDPSFKLFRSDIDLTLVIPDSTDRKTFEEILARYRKLHHWLLPLGEIEIYTKTEHRLKSEIERTHGGILRTIRLLRKIRNEVNFLKQPLPSYHRRKAENAINKIKRELTKDHTVEGFGLALTDALKYSSSNFLDYPFDVPAEIHGASSFLGWNLSSSLKTDSDTIVLTPKICFALASLLPDADFAFDPWMEEINKYRHLDFVRERLLAIATMEFILVRGVTRMSLQEPSSEDWSLRLERLIETYDPKILETLKKGGLNCASKSD